ncbi:MAG: hypothetical protein NC341_08970 [Blautia sp.]|nr:hypothetical protein [Blautia sp.]MCM1201877.1 hypothetical protein [Bacteroides fragilis]
MLETLILSGLRHFLFYLAGGFCNKETTGKLHPGDLEKIEEMYIHFMDGTLPKEWLCKAYWM